MTEVSKSMEWFLYDMDFRHKRVNPNLSVFFISYTGSLGEYKIPQLKSKTRGYYARKLRKNI